MNEAKFRRVEGLAAEVKRVEQLANPLMRRPAIDRIAEQRMADRRHVDPYLVRAPGLQPAFYQRGVAPVLELLPMGDGALASPILHDCDFLAVAARAGEGRVYCTFHSRRHAGHGGKIAAVDRVRLELLGQPFVGDVGLGDNQEAGRVLVDPVNDPGPGNSADSGQASAAMVEQGVDQCSVAVARGGMNDQPGRLVDHQQMLVFEEDGERDFLRFVVRRLGLGNGQAELLAARDLGCRVAERGAAAVQRAGADQRFQPLAGERRKCVGEGAIQPPACMGRRQSHVDNLLPPGHRQGCGAGAFRFQAGLPWRG